VTRATEAAKFVKENPMVDQNTPDRQFDAMTSRLLRREALRRAAEELGTMTGPGLEQALARVSAEVTEEAAYRNAAGTGKADHAHAAAPVRTVPGQV
jgi:phage shock protein A